MDVWGCRGPITRFERILLGVVLGLLTMCFLIGLPFLAYIAVRFGF